MPSRYDHLNKEELVRLLQARDLRDKTRFGLVWEANEIERDKALNDDFVALDLVPDLSCGNPTNGWSNLIIEGDNFDALRYLRMTHSGLVKCIFIDPPYNTGNKDFVYNDSFVDKEDGWRHSKWCEFMYQRLVLAKQLLRNDGSIFVSIDDNELFHLGLIMNKVFGESRFVANCVWQKRYSTPNDHKSIAPIHDYILVYQASDDWKCNRLERSADKDRLYKLTDEQGTFRCSDYTCNKSFEERPNLYYSIIQPNTGEEIWPKKTAVWRYSKETHEENVKQNLVYWGKDGQGRVPAFKRYKHKLKYGDSVVPGTWWPFEEVGHNDSAKKELMQVLHEQERAFSTPKPTTLIDRILKLATGPEDIVLDFFAGSGTTAHAVAKLNAEDGGNRKFILVSSTEATVDNPDKNLCRDVCAERVRRVIEGYSNGEKKVEGLGGDFAYLRTRRIKAGDLLSIEHEQVWIALQLHHFGTLAPWQEGEFLCAGDEGQTIIYIPSWNRRLAPAIRKRCKECAGVVIYSWQPGAVKQSIRYSHIDHRAIPATLAQKFRLK